MDASLAEGPGTNPGVSKLRRPGRASVGRRGIAVGGTTDVRKTCTAVARAPDGRERSRRAPWRVLARSPDGRRHGGRGPPDVGIFPIALPVRRAHIGLAFTRRIPVDEAFSRDAAGGQ